VSVVDGEAVNLWGRGSEFGLADIGRGRAYWYLTKNAPEGQADAPEGRKAEVLGHLEGWYEPARAAVEATEDGGILRTDIYDRDPLGPRWGEGRVTLLGDAAHPMTPNLGQGACQAVEDAIALSEALGQSGSVVAALRLYEARRAGRTARVVRLSRRMGRAYQAENPLLCGLRDAVAGAMPPRAQLRQLESVVGGRG
jgi:2-polyprenyl-6-methoxyphenol hydroxylase-like FAD-dependent oxidoreductase